MKKIILASLFIVAAIGAQPVFAASSSAGLCSKSMKLCACGKLPGAMWSCCDPRAKCDCGSGIPNCKH